MKRAPPSASSQAWQHGIIWAVALVPVLGGGRGDGGGSWWGGDSTHLEGIAGALLQIWLILTLHHQHVLGCSSIALPLSSLLWHSASLLLSLLSLLTPLHQDMKLGRYTEGEFWPLLLTKKKMGAFSKCLYGLLELHFNRLKCRKTMSSTKRLLL